jgi:hypothetical protein
MEGQEGIASTGRPEYFRGDARTWMVALWILWVANPNCDPANTLRNGAVISRMPSQEPIHSRTDHGARFNRGDALSALPAGRVRRPPRHAAIGV